MTKHTREVFKALIDDAKAQVKDLKAKKDTNGMYLAKAYLAGIETAKNALIFSEVKI